LRMPLRFQVQGGRPLSGTVRPAGNKNAALPILASTLLADGPVHLSNVPRIRDVESMAALLSDLGASVQWTGPNALTVDTRSAVSKPLDPALCARIRASILFAAPLVARFALRFGPPEFFAVQLLTFCSFVGMGREPPIKTIAAMMLGFALAAVGLDTVTGQLRMTYGFTPLLQGFDFLIAVIGLFGLGEILLTMEEGLSFKGKGGRINPKIVWQTWKLLPKFWPTSIRAVLIGCWMGVTPGGATPASFMSYGMAKRLSKNRDKFGEGQIEGVIAPETAAHAAGTSALLPMLTLGIPGSPTAAVLLGGLLIWGLQPGPLLFVEKPDFVWGLIASMYLGNIAGLLIVLTTVPWWAAILRIPFAIIAPIIVVICAIGAYTVHNNIFDVYMMVVFGVLGYLFKKLKYPLAPLVLALVLGDMAETAFRQSMLLSKGNLGIFWSNPLVGSIVTLALILLAWPLIARLITAMRAKPREAAPA